MQTINMFNPRSQTDYAPRNPWRHPIPIHSSTPPKKRINADHKELSTAHFYSPVFPEVIHTVTYSSATCIHYRYDEDCIQAVITIDTSYQVVTRHAYSLCKPMKTPILHDNLSCWFSLSTGFPQALWRALFAGKTQRKSPWFPKDFFFKTIGAGWDTLSRSVGSSPYDVERYARFRAVTSRLTLGVAFFKRFIRAWQMV
jgi:hypothetical protein